MQAQLSRGWGNKPGNATFNVMKAGALYRCVYIAAACAFGTVAMVLARS